MGEIEMEMESVGNDDWVGEPRDVPTKISLKDFDKLVDSAFNKRADIDEAEKKAKDLRADLDKLSKQILFHLDDCQKKGYDHGRGKLTVTEYLSVKIPRDPVGRQEFFGYLKKQGHFDDLITVNSRSLQSYYKQEFEAAVEAGAKSFEIPGIGPPNYSTRLSYRRKK